MSRRPVRTLVVARVVYAAMARSQAIREIAGRNTGIGRNRAASIAWWIRERVDVARAEMGHFAGQETGRAPGAIRLITTGANGDRILASQQTA